MRAFVTGATGFIGRHLVTQLLRRRWSVCALVRHSGRARVLPDEAIVIRGALDDEAALAEGLNGADVVFHLAAAIQGPWSLHQRITVDGTRRLMQLGERAGVSRFVLVSSLAVYDKRRLADGAPIDEDGPILPAAPSSGAYARARVATEALARAVDPNRMAVTVLRLGLVYGPEKIVFPHLGEIVGERRMAFGKPSLRLPLIEVESAVDALLRVAVEPAAAGRTYHAVDTSEVSRGQYVQMLEELCGLRLGVKYVPTWPVMAACRTIEVARRIVPLRALADVSAEKIRLRSVEADYRTERLQRDTGWMPGPAVRDGLARSLGVQLPGTGVTIERVGLIGAGVIAPLHLDALRRIAGVHVVGILDTNPEAARMLGARTNVRAFDDPAQFWREARPDIVHVLTPPQTHAAVARDALERGVHVLLEKPAVSSTMQCDALLAAARPRDLTIGVDENVAWDPRVQHACALHMRGVLGDLVHVDIFMGFDVRRARLPATDGAAGSSWALQLPGGLLEDLLPHPLSVAMRLAGRELQVLHWRCTSMGRIPSDVPDELRLSCLGRDRATVDIAISLAVRPDDFLVTVHGTRATVRMDLQNMLMDAVTPIPGPRAIARGVRTVRSGVRTLGQTMCNALMIGIGKAPPPGSPVHLLRAHYAALAAGRELPAPLAQARAIVEITRTLWPASKDTASRESGNAESTGLAQLRSEATATG